MYLQDRYGRLIKDLQQARELADSIGLKNKPLDKLTDELGNDFYHYKNQIIAHASEILAKHFPAQTETMFLLYEGEITEYDRDRDYIGVCDNLARDFTNALDFIVEVDYHGLKSEVSRLISQAEAQND